ncbi:MAG TPA: ABC transporter ATP-binding protein [Euzebyales bacterium]|nr:ABC transporter ATP-binding protein [Euzebyales bacterium]
MRYGFEQVTVAFGARPAVTGVTLATPPGAITALVGGDGAGKTTLLRCLAGRVAPSRGRVHRAPLVRTGVLTADPPGYDHLTVAQNLRFVARVRGLPPELARERGARMLAATGLDDARDRLAERLSGGMRRKLGFVLATLHEPEVLLLDEPTTGVDPVSRTDLWWLITAAAGRGTAVVLSTTYLDEAERCSQVLALDGGRVLAQGSPEAIIAPVRHRLYRVAGDGPADRSWRRGRDRRLWAPAGAPPDATPVEPDLEDAIVVAMLTGTPARAVKERA